MADRKIKSSEFRQLSEKLVTDQDLLAEELLKNINTTPLGQLLKKIAVLPEIRQEKVNDMRSRIARGEYDLNKRLDLALDRVLEELIS
ncbi:MAG: hypothetical protein A2178_00460 [Planctomycetes bacterium GWC2_49_10]|nr:MAG: hypothetical protein A2178_00460 [Planctomycetes bacterium GWC2_49_10]